MAKTTSQIIAENRIKRAEADAIEASRNAIHNQQMAAIAETSAAKTKAVLRNAGLTKAASAVDAGYKAKPTTIQTTVPEEKETSVDKMWDRGSQRSISDTTAAKYKAKEAEETAQEKKKTVDAYKQTTTYKENDQKRKTEGAQRANQMGFNAPRNATYTPDAMEQQLKREADRAERAAQSARDEVVTVGNVSDMADFTPEEMQMLDDYNSGAGVDTYSYAGNPQARRIARKRAEAKEYFTQNRNISEERLEELAETRRRQTNEEKAVQTEQQARDAVNRGIWSATKENAKSVPMEMAGGLLGTAGYIDEMLNRTGQYSTLDPNNAGNLVSLYADTVRDQTTQNIAGEDDGVLRQAAAMGYQALMTTADTLARAYTLGAVGGASLAATKTFADTMSDASAQGATPGEAAALATVNALIEEGTEAIPLDDLIKAAKGTNGRAILLNALRQAGIEASTEELSLLGTTLAEAAILQDKAEYSLMVDEMVQNGASLEEARAVANRQVMNEAVTTLVVSGLSGGLSGSVATLKGRNATVDVQEQTAEADTTESAPAQPKTEGQEKRGFLESVIGFIKPALDTQSASREQTGAQLPEGAFDFLKPKGNKKTETQLNTGTEQTVQETAQQPQATSQTGEAAQPQKVPAQPKTAEQERRETLRKLTDLTPAQNAKQETLEKLTGFTKSEQIRPQQNAARPKQDAKAENVDSQAAQRYNNTRSEQVQNAIDRLNTGGNATPKLIAGYGDKPTQTYLYLTGQGGNKNGGLGSDLRTVGGQSSENAGGTSTAPESTAVPADLLAGYDWYNNDVARGEAPRLIQTSEHRTSTTDTHTPVQTGESTVQEQSTEDGQGQTIKGTGAAERNFSGVAAYEDMLADDNIQQQRPGAVRDVEMPMKDADGRRVTEFAGNVVSAGVTPDPMADAVKSLVGDKKLSFDTRTNEQSLENAAKAIKTQGDTNVISTIHTNAENKTIVDGDIEKALVLYAKYANDPDPEAQETAAQLIVDAGTLANMSGRNLQLFSLMQRMTPEGRMKALKKDLARSIKQINAGRSKNKQVDLSKPDVMTDKRSAEAVTTARKSTEEQVKGASGKVRYKGGKVEVEGNQTGEPFVFEYAQKVGEALAKGLENSQKKKPQKTFLQTMTSELRKFAAEKIPASQREKQLTPTELLRDYIQNQDFYAEAWSAAQETLRQKHGNDPQYQEFMNSGIGVDANANPQNKIMTKALAAAAMETGETTEMLRKQQALGVTGMSEIIADKLIKDTGATGETAQTIRDAAYEFVKNRINEADSREKAKTYDAGYFVNQAMRDIKQSMTDVAKKNAQGRAAAKQAVIDSLTKKYGISQTDARNIADVVGDTFDQKAQEQAQKILEQKFGEREKTQPKSAGQMIEEYANLGAYGQESRYSEKATESFLRAAMRDIGTTVSEIAKSGKADKEAVLSQISLMITERHGIDKTDANNIARIVVDQMNKMTKAQAQKILEQKFRDRPGRNKKTSQQVFEELANLGAFDVGSKFNEAASKKVLGDDVDVYINEELAQKFLDAKTDKEKEAVMDEIYKDVASRIKPTLGEAWDAWRNLAMLGNFKTHERNFFSTGAFKPYTAVKRRIGAALERVFVERDKRTKAVLGVGKEANALLRWARADAKSNTVKDLLGSAGTAGDDARSAIQDYRKILPGPLDAVRKANLALMENEDKFFKRGEYTRSLAGFLKARGYTAEQLQNNQVPRGVLDEARQYAIKEAQKATFNDRNEFTDNITKLSKTIDNFGTGARIVRKGILPYVKTPANAVKRLMEYNPVSMMKTMLTAKGDIDSGRKSAADVVDEISAGLTGTAAIALGAALAAGVVPGVELIGSLDDEDEVREGAMEYSIRIGGKYYSVAWLAPAMIPLFMGANLYQTFSNWDEDMDGWDLAKAILLDTTVEAINPMLELSMLSSLNNFVDAVSNEETAGDKAMAAFMGAASSYFIQGIPTIAGQFEQATEESKNSTYVNTDNELEKAVKKTLADATKRIPGVDLYQTEKLNEWGEPVKNEGSPLERTMAAMFNPSSETEVKDDPLTKEITRLNRVQTENVSPPSFSKIVSYTDIHGNIHANIRLTEEQYQTMARTQGQTSKRLISEMLLSDDYKAMTDAQKAEAVQLIYDYAREKGRAAAIEGYPNVSGWMVDISTNRGAENIVEKVVADSLNGALEDVGNAWKQGWSAEQYSRNLETAYDSYSKLSSQAKKKVLEKASSTTRGYIEAREAGIEQNEYLDVSKRVFDIKPEGEYKNANQKQKAEVVASTKGLNEEEKTVLLKYYMSDAQDQNIDDLAAMGYDTGDFAYLYRSYCDYTSGYGKKNRTIQKWMKDYSISYSDAKALYEIFQ